MSTATTPAASTFAAAAIVSPHVAVNGAETWAFVRRTAAGCDRLAFTRVPGSTDIAVGFVGADGREDMWSESEADAAERVRIARHGGFKAVW